MITFEPIADALDALGRGTFVAAIVGFFGAVAAVTFDWAYQDLADAMGVDR